MTMDLLALKCLCLDEMMLMMIMMSRLVVVGIGVVF